MDFREINWPGLASSLGAATLVLLSVFYAAPWWRVVIGEGVGLAEISPLDFRADLAGVSVEVPIVWFLNVGSKLTMVACAVVMFLYSVTPQKGFSRVLLGFAYKKPLLMLGFFSVTLVVSTMYVEAYFGVYIPLMGTVTLLLSGRGVTASVPVSTSFTWVFWLAVATTVLALVAKIYDLKVRVQEPSMK